MQNERSFHLGHAKLYPSDLRKIGFDEILIFFFFIIIIFLKIKAGTNI